MSSLEQLKELLEAEERLRSEVESWKKTREAEVLREVASSIVDDWLVLNGHKKKEQAHEK